jgi:hypothetical protein
MANEALNLAMEIIHKPHDEKLREQNVKKLLELIPSLTTSEIDSILERIEGEFRGDDPLWKRQIVGQIAEVFLIRRPIPSNPLSIGIKHLYEQLEALNFTGIEFFSSVIQIAVLVPLLALFAIIWPYGLIPVAAGTIWKIILISRLKIKFKTQGIMEKMPLTLAIGIYFLIWLPFALLCLPFVIIGWLGTLISGDA